MAILTEISNRFLTLSSRYKDQEIFFNALKAEESFAIRYLFNKIKTTIHQIGQNNGLQYEDIEELISDSIVILIQKMRDGQYHFQGFDPSGFVIATAKLNVNNYRRRNVKSSTDKLPEFFDMEDKESNPLENIQLLDKLLQKLGGICEQIIRLKYLEEKKDNEVIQLQLLSFSTVDSLKNQRSRCLKKLIELGQQSKMQ